MVAAVIPRRDKIPRRDRSLIPRSERFPEGTDSPKGQVLDRSQDSPKGQVLDRSRSLIADEPAALPSQLLFPTANEDSPRDRSLIAGSLIAFAMESSRNPLGRRSDSGSLIQLREGF